MLLLCCSPLIINDGLRVASAWGRVYVIKSVSRWELPLAPSLAANDESCAHMATAIFL
jgi:hypothetical protein